MIYTIVRRAPIRRDTFWQKRLILRSSQSSLQKGRLFVRCTSHCCCRFQGQFHGNSKALSCILSKMFYGLPLFLDQNRTSWLMLLNVQSLAAKNPPGFKILDSTFLSHQWQIKYQILDVTKKVILRKRKEIAAKIDW